MPEVAETKRGGMVVGPPHNADGTKGGGVHFVVEDTGRVLEEEGFEINIPNELRDRKEIYTFRGKNIDVLNKILKLAGLSITDKVQNVRSRDVVICVRSAWDDTEREFTGTIEQILHQINTSMGCKPIPSTSSTLLGNGGTVSELNSKGGYNYSGPDKVIAKRCGLVTLPESIPGTNCGNCIFFGSGFCSHSKVLLPVTSRQCCQFWDDKSFRSHLTNIWQADFFADRSVQYPLNKEGGYDYTGKALDRAREADLITLPEDIKGTNCADTNCMYGKKGLCVHPRIMLPVTDRMSCAWWDNTDVKRPWGAPVEIEFLGEGGPIHPKARKKDWQAEHPNSPRWKKKKESIQELSNSIHRLRLKVGKDITSEDERTALTAMVVALMDRTAERIGNDDSADNGHFGVTGFRKEHIRVVGNKVHLDYVGKSGTKHDKSISDLRIAKALKKAMKNAPGKFLFETTDGFRIKSDKVNRYLEQFNISAKDLRGYNANRWIIEQLKSQKVKSEDPTKAKKERKNIFNKAVKQTAQRVGHGAATLKKHYMIPELPVQYIEHGRIIDMKNIGYYLDGGPLGDLKSEDYFENKNQTPDIVNKKVQEIYIEAQDEGIDKLFREQFIKEVEWKDVVPTQDFLRSSKFATVEAVDDIYSINLPWAIEYQGKYYINDGHHRAVEMHKRNLPIKLHVYPIEEQKNELLNKGGITNENKKTTNMNKITVLYNFNHPKMGFQNSITVEAKDNESAIQKAEKAVSETYGRNMLKMFSFKVPDKMAEGSEVTGKTPKKKIDYPTERLSVSDQSIEERELQLFIENDADLYRQRTVPIQTNLVTKIARGIFDINKAPLIYKYLIDDAIKKYNKEYGGGMELTKAEKENLQKTFVNEFLDEAGYGNYENYLPKKYQMRGGGGIPFNENSSTEEEEETEGEKKVESEKPTCICFSSFLKESYPGLPEKLMQEDINTNPKLRTQVDEAYQAWRGGSMPHSKRKQ